MNENIYIKHPVKNIVEIMNVMTIHYFEFTKDYRYQGESHDFWEFMYIDRGHAIVTYGEEEYFLNSGESIFYQPNHFHSIRADEKPFNVFIISFDAKSNVLDLLGGKIFELSSKMKELIRSIIAESNLAFSMPMSDQCVQHLEERQDAVLGSQQIVKMRMEELIILLLRQGDANHDISIFTSKSKFDDHIAKKIEFLLKENLYQQLTLTEIVNQLGYGKTYLSSVFKRVYGESIMSYYTNLKIEEAKYLLRENTMTIAEIAEKLAFSSPQYFSRRFSEIVQMSPQQYANSVKERWKTVF